MSHHQFTGRKAAIVFSLFQLQCLNAFIFHHPRQFRSPRRLPGLSVVKSNELNELNGSTTSRMNDLIEKSMGSNLNSPLSTTFEAIACAVNLDDLSVPFVSRMDSKATFVEFTEDGLCVPAGPVGQTKEELANFLEQPIIELIVCTSVVLSCFLVALSTVGGMPYLGAVRTTLNVIGVFFVMEFALRWFSSSRDPGRHVLSPQFAVDVVAVILPVLFSLTPASFWAATWLPDWLTSPSGLINLELLRVLRLQRVLQDMDSFTRFERALGIPNNEVVKEWQLQLARVILSLFTLLSVTTGMIYTAEHDVNPMITDYFTAFYFGLTTLTTVGFGVTSAGKLVVCGSILAGVALIPAQAATLVEALLKRQEAKNSRPQFNRRMKADEERNDGKMVLDTLMPCPACGASMHWSTARFCYACGEEL